MANPVGRPTKFTEETRNKIITALRGGNYRQTAAQYAGISHTTLRNWLLLAADPQAPPEYVEFLAAVEKAEADAEVADLAMIRRAAQEGAWTAAAWVRERKNPERWGKRDRTDVTLSGPDGGPVSMQVTAGADAMAIASLAAILAGRFAERQDPLGPPSKRVIDVTSSEEDAEVFRIAPGELSAGSPSLRPQDASHAVQPHLEPVLDPDVAEYQSRQDEQAEFEALTAGLEPDPAWDWESEIDDDAGWSDDDE